MVQLNARVNELSERAPFFSSGYSDGVMVDYYVTDDGMSENGFPPALYSRIFDDGFGTRATQAD